MGNFLYSTPDNDVLRDTSLTATTYRVYNYLESLADRGTHETFPKVITIANDLGICKRTVQYCLKTLHEKGIVERILRKSESNPKYNAPSRFIIHGRLAPCYAKQEQQSPIWVQPVACMGATSCIQVLESPVQEESLRITLKGEAETSQTIGNIPKISEETVGECEAQETTFSEAPEAPERARKSQVEERPSVKADLTGVPDIMLPTARYWLQRTGHTALTDKDVSALVELSNTQYPTYVNKEIDVAVERFTRLGRNLRTLHMGYIVKCMAGKRTYSTDAKPPTRNKRRGRKAAQVQCVQEVAPHASVENEAIVVSGAMEVSAPATPVEMSEPVMSAEPLAMPVEEAKSVIAEHEAEQPVQASPLPPALVELHKAIEAKNQEVIDERMSQLPQDEFGAILPDDDEEVEKIFEGIGLEDYLRVKFPDATDEELSTEHLNPSDQRILEDAMKIDKACALCSNPSFCDLPKGCDKTHFRPVVMLKPDLRGRKRVTIGYGGCVRCKHNCVCGKPDPEFERMVKICGLSPKQKEQTFATYDHAAAGAEAIVAKAMAILAAKKKRNLVLAGKAGTGKTHLAIAIALEVMKSGQQAIVKTVPDLMDELIAANRNNTDPFGLIMKYKSVPCLVLDDLGKQTNTEAVWKYLYQLVNYRYQYGLQTIVTTNAYDENGLKRKWNEDKVEPVMSRILENGDWVTISEAESYRMKIRSRVREEEKIAYTPVPAKVEVKPEPAEAESVDATDFEAECVEPVIEDCKYAFCSEDELNASKEIESPAMSEAAEEPPARPKHYMEEEWYINLSVVDKLAVQMARYQKHVAEQEAAEQAAKQKQECGEVEAEATTSEPEAPASNPTPEEEAQEKAKIDAWLDEQCEAAAMSDEEIDAMVGEAIEGDKQLRASAEESKTPQSGGTIIHVPHYDDGLDDDEEDLRLYGGVYSK